ncbi:multiprotein-bridging factor 1 [Kickxella alabastrina]|uniref:Multiprotein-bridging factor 1 n=2 Tax=Kickxella alabastrina TaxID=61397 RepID=A0ACC1IMH4_9FUNG|nr:multiprotein-bridging factor 1 [Kickxella alabastrina]KAJ1896631.1 multiprotein-bridging factor 1 [Kickxella alabastrina]
MADWDSKLIVSKPQARTATVRTTSQLNAAARSGNIIATERASSVANKSHHVNTDHRRIAELDRSDDVKPPPTVKLGVGKAISAARLRLGLTQKDLATKINEKNSVINDYENARAIPNQQILGKLERILGVKLRGSDIGAALPAPGAKKAAAK